MPALDAFNLDGKVSVVTGAKRGIGRALALGLAGAGSDVALLVRGADGAGEQVAELEALGVRAQAFEGDVTDRASVEAAAGRIEEAFGGVDVLVNNAGTCIHAPSFEVSEEDFRTVLDVNVTGVWNCSQAFARNMSTEAGGRGGAIVNIGSISAIIVNRPQWQPAYNASKAAVHQLTKSLAVEWAPLGIRVNALAPGYIKTEMAPVDRPEFKARWIDDAPQQRYASPEELVPSVVYLSTPASSFVTGSVLVIDGGYTAV